MFTGIIEETGTVVGLGNSEEFCTLRIEPGRLLDGLKAGDSIAVNGVCLTVRTFDKAGFTADLSRETLNKTSLSKLVPGTTVNLERPLRADGRFGGHIVQGHVDGVGQIVDFAREGDNWNLRVRFPADAARYLVTKGSIAVDGISLTVAALAGDTFDVAIIPHTFENTNLGQARPGDPVNLEFDVIAKYVERMLVR